jgi:hypothetical protein
MTRGCEKKGVRRGNMVSPTLNIVRAVQQAAGVL